MNGTRILCFNVGSSGTRLAGFENGASELRETLPRISVSDSDWRRVVRSWGTPDLVAHRIVRGTKTRVAAEVYTDAVNSEILRTEDLAPTHDPHALTLLAGTQAAFPRARQVVVYDTAFHATIPAEYATYAIPEDWRAQGVERVGYHGLSCAYAADWLRKNVGERHRAVHAHLGGGCSVTALRDGKSIATTMGYTPLEGLVMGTRSGSVDPGILLHLARSGVSPAELRTALFRESGLRALCGTSEMREVEARLGRGDPKAQLAFDVFAASASGAIAQMAAAAGGIDVLTFAGGIGLNSNAVRAAISGRLQWMLGGVRMAVLDVQEELMMARAALALRAPVSG